MKIPRYLHMTDPTKINETAAEKEAYVVENLRQKYLEKGSKEKVNTLMQALSLKRPGSGTFFEGSKKVEYGKEVAKLAEEFAKEDIVESFTYLGEAQEINNQYSDVFLDKRIESAEKSIENVSPPKEASLGFGRSESSEIPLNIESENLPEFLRKTRETVNRFLPEECSIGKIGARKKEVKDQTENEENPLEEIYTPEEIYKKDEDQIFNSENPLLEDIDRDI